MSDAVSDPTPEPSLLILQPTKPNGRRLLLVMVLGIVVANALFLGFNPSHIVWRQLASSFVVELCAGGALVGLVLMRWRRALSQGGPAPISFSADHLSLPPNGYSRKLIDVAYGDVRSMRLGGGNKPRVFFLDTRNRVFAYPVRAFSVADPLAAFEAALRQHIDLTQLTLIRQRNSLARLFAGRKPYATFLLLGLLVAVYLLQLRHATAPGIWRDIFWGGNAPLLVRAGQYYRLITANLLHKNFPHLWGNGIVLLALGDFVERQLGTARFLLLILATAFTSQLGSCLYSLYWSPHIVTIGFSGADYGLIGAMVALHLRFHRILPGRYHIGPRRWTLLLASCVLAPLIAKNAIQVDHVAHVCGFLAGVAVTWLLTLGQPGVVQSARHARFITAVLAGSVVLVVVAISQGALHLTSATAREADRRDLLALIADAPNTTPTIATSIARQLGADPTATADELRSAHRAAQLGLRDQLTAEGPDGPATRDAADVLATITYLQGDYATAVKLEAPLLAATFQNLSFDHHFTYFLAAYYVRYGVYQVGPSLGAHWGTVDLTVVEPRLRSYFVAFTIPAPLPRAALVRIVATRGGKLLGLISVRLPAGLWGHVNSKLASRIPLDGSVPDLAGATLLIEQVDTLSNPSNATWFTALPDDQALMP